MVAFWAGCDKRSIECEGFVASVNFAVELGVADLFEQVGELRAGCEAVADEVGTVDERRRIEALGGPGESFAAEGECWSRRGRRWLRGGRASSAAPSWVSRRCSLGQGSWRRCAMLRTIGEEPGGAFDFFVGVAEAAADGGLRERGVGSMGVSQLPS